MIDVYRISWEEVMRMSKILASGLQGKRIFGIPRGGLVVASIMSFYGSPRTPDAGSADIIVDDIACTGATLQAYDRTPAATLIVRQGCDYIPTYWVTMLQVSEYILFPWEDEKVVELQLAQGSFRSRDS